ncbi:hypothetical protein K469DRAFT_761117 [Zopfia rhizophila CBS 207.26]|uniref:Uncharacterized protein n=1 Tax=Zopfia rhizophila CBS 207.26 TaxID=1314779 RepID=A0A6A6DF57_9PEZI|nr:hypothetical protein K469DRAFT_761117 [Zopfia rhizophila CBS 207.26]
MRTFTSAALNKTSKFESRFKDTTGETVSSKNTRITVCKPFKHINYPNETNPENGHVKKEVTAAYLALKDYSEDSIKDARKSRARNASPTSSWFATSEATTPSTPSANKTPKLSNAIPSATLGPSSAAFKDTTSPNDPSPNLSPSTTFTLHLTECENSVTIQGVLSENKHRRVLDELDFLHTENERLKYEKVKAAVKKD